jgi:hypothetical protein
MNRLMIAVGVAGAGLLLGSCATMSEDQCRAGAWGEVGYADGLEGYPMSRLDDHVEACAKYGVAPEPTVYESARADGLTQYCTVPRGFQEGRQGDTYYGVCAPAQEAEFLPAYQDGQVVHEAETALASVRSSVDSLGARLTELDEKITAKQNEMRQSGLTDEQRDTIRNRIREIRRERDGTEDEWRRARQAIGDAEDRARDVRWRFERIYGGW